MAQSLKPDRVYQQVVKRHAVEPIANGLKPRSTHTGAYCKARQRLPLEMSRALVRETAREMGGTRHVP